MSKLNKKQRSFLRKLLIAFVILYLVFSLYLLHVGLVMELAGPNMNFDEAMREGFTDMLKYPFQLTPFPTVMLPIIFGIPFLLMFAIFVLYNKQKAHAHYDDKTVQGSSTWFKNFEEFNMKYNAPYGSKENDGIDNMIISANLKLGYNNNKTRRNTNLFVIGGSGAGKSFTLVGPNIMQMNTSMVITDPSGELFSEYGNLLECNGYKVKCFNLDHMDQGNHYNPFEYISTSVNITTLVDSILANTSNPTQSGGDQFWTDSAKIFLCATIAFLVETRPMKDRTFSNLMDMLAHAQAVEDKGGAVPTSSTESSSGMNALFSGNRSLDDLFDDLERAKPDSWAVTQYKLYKQAGEKTASSILVTISSRLQILTVDAVRALTNSDDMELDRIGDEKTALFICIPTGQSTFNFLASMMYTQLFQLNYQYAQNRAEYSQLIVDDNEEIWQTLKSDREHAEETKVQAKEYFDRILTTAFVQYNEEFNWYEIRTKAGELVGWRGTQEMAEEALVHLKRGRVKPNSEQTHHGQRMPIHLTFIMDEFANTGRVPDFPEFVATIRKFDISVMIFLQSVTQMQTMYKEGWEGIAGNCDTLVFLGGGADTVTGDWANKLLGKETRIVSSTSFQNGNKGGSVSYSKSGVDLLSTAEFRSLDENKCVVVFKSLQGVFDAKYISPNHPKFAMKEKLNKERGSYFFNPKKSVYLQQQSEAPVNSASYEHGSVPKENKEETRRVNHQIKTKASEARENKDAVGKPIIGDSKPVNRKTGAINPETGEVLQDEPQEMDLQMKTQEEVKEAVKESKIVNLDFFNAQKIMYTEGASQL